MIPHLYPLFCFLIMYLTTYHQQVQSLHKLLQYAHGEDYIQDVSSFAFQWLEDMPRQDNK